MIISPLILILSCIYISGCWSLPRTTDYSQLYSITKEAKKIKSGFGNRKVVAIKDFRETEMYEENITALKEGVEKYILAHPDLSDQTKNNLRELKVTAGATQDEVRLLLGNPDKVRKRSNGDDPASEIWIYRINKRSAFTIIVIPVFFTHEGYYLYFKENTLDAIKRHYLEHVIKTESPLAAGS